MTAERDDNLEMQTIKYIKIRNGHIKIPDESGNEEYVVVKIQEIDLEISNHYPSPIPNPYRG
jgi:hypothetical protein